MSKCKQEKVKNGRIRCSLSSPGSKPEVFPLTFIKYHMKQEISTLFFIFSGFFAEKRQFPDDQHSKKEKPTPSGVVLLSYLPFAPAPDVIQKHQIVHVLQQKLLKKRHRTYLLSQSTVLL